MKLSQYEIEDLIDRLKTGETIPEDYKYKLFPAKQKEYELVYGGKMRKEDILANEDGVFPVPFQVEKIFNGTRKSWPDGWKNIIAFGDNLQFLKTIYENKDPFIKDKIKGKVKLIYIDPPFGTGDEYDGNKGQKGYSAKTKGAEFVEFLRKRLIVAKEILSEDGSIFIRIDYHFAHYVKIVLDEIFGKDNFQNEIVINRFKRQLKNLKRYNHATDSIFFYSKSQVYDFYEVMRERLNTFTGEKAEPVWRGMSSPGLRNPQEREIFGQIMWPPSGRHWTFKQSTLNGLIKENRIRINDKVKYTDTKGKKIQGLPEYLQSKLVPVDNLWTDLKGYVFNASYPTENPEELLQRVILSASKEGEIIMDFFAGSGSFASTAEKLNRKWISCDIGKLSFYNTQKRILNLAKSKSLDNPKSKYRQEAKSFVTINTGHYDLEKVFNLRKEEYSNFVTKLFEIEPINKTISGIKIDGQRNDGHYTLIWQYWDFEDANLDEEYLHNLHSNIGKKVGDRIYIIAPASYVDFISDYYEIENVRYYFLKVPYHIIKELHKVEFKKFRQPQSKKNINDLDDAIGFHFMKQPEVLTEVTITEKEVKICIKKFLSDFSEDDKGNEMSNLESLAMVLIDKDFDGNSFDLDEYYFAEDLLPKKTKKQEEVISKELKNSKEINLPKIPKKQCGKNIMLIYVDVFGNEFKEDFAIK